MLASWHVPSSSKKTCTKGCTTHSRQTPIIPKICVPPTSDHTNHKIWIQKYFIFYFCTSNSKGTNIGIFLHDLTSISPSVIFSETIPQNSWDMDNLSDHSDHVKMKPTKLRLRSAIPKTSHSKQAKIQAPKQVSFLPCWYSQVKYLGIPVSIDWFHGIINSHGKFCSCSNVRMWGHLQKVRLGFVRQIQSSNEVPHSFLCNCSSPCQLLQLFIWLRNAISSHYLYIYNKQVGSEDENSSRSENDRFLRPKKPLV